MAQRKRTPLNRRRFLAGAAGVTLGLPFLETFAGKSASAARQHGFAVFFKQGNGVAQAIPHRNEPERFWPRTIGALTSESMQGRAVNELANYRNDLLIVKGVNYPNFNGTGCAHATWGAACLTATQATSNPGGADALATGESADNRIARELNAPGVEPLTLMSAPSGSYIGAMLSYRGSRDRRGAITSPFTAYSRVVNLVDPGEVNTAQDLRRKSVNDLVRDQMNALMSRNDLSSHDRQRLQLHFDAVRDLEIRIAECAPMDPSRVAEIENLGNATTNNNRAQATEMFVDIMAFAIACEYTYSGTIQVGSGNDGTEYTINGQKLPRFHQISHRIYSDGSDGPPIPGADLKHHEVDKLQGRMFRRLLDKLSQYTTERGTLLNEGVCAWISDVATGPGHGRENLPFVLAGNAGGFLRTGRFIDVGGKTNNKMLNTIISAAGVRKSGGGLVDDFGANGLEGGQLGSMLA